MGLNEFRRALPQDEAELRRLCALPVPGNWLDLSYQREPHFFSSLCHSGEEVLIGRYRGGPLAAMALRCPHRLHVGKEIRPLGYLGGLRIDPRFQGRLLLFEGFALLRQLQQEHPIEECLATVVWGNQLARQLLVEKSRPGRPRFWESGNLFTLALETAPGPLPAFQEKAPALIGEQGRLRPYFPADHPTIEGERRLWVEHEGVGGALRILGATRQNVVHAYRGALRWGWPLYNLWAHSQGRAGLPPPGGRLAGGYLGFWCSDGFRPQAFTRWLRQMLALGHAQGLQWVYLGLAGDDPYLRHALCFPHQLYRSQIYRVRFEGPPEPLPPQPLYLELAWL